MKKSNNWVSLIIGILAGAIIVFLFKGSGGDKIQKLEDRIKKNEKEIGAKKMQNDSLKREILAREITAEMLLNEINETKKQHEKEILKIEQSKKQFKKLPKSDRDSIVRAYIAANQ